MTYLDTQHARSFVAVAREGNITRAAARLHLTQQAVSLHIRQLERTLGVTLLIRSSGGVILTPAGEELASGGAEVLTDLAALAVRVQSVARRQEGRLRVTCCPYSTMGFAARIADAMEVATPDIEVELLTVHTPSAEVELLVSGGADAAFMWMPVDDERLNYSYVRRDPRVVAVAEGHRLADRDSVTLAELAEDPVILPNVLLSDAAVRHWLAEPRPGGHNAIRGPVAREVSDTLLMVARGRGVWLAPDAITEWASVPGIRWIPVVDAEPTDLAVVWVPSAPTQLIARLISVVRDVTGWVEEPVSA